MGTLRDTLSTRRVPAYCCHIGGCDRVFDSLPGYVRHYQTLHQNACSFCRRSFPSDQLLDIHLLERHGTVPSSPTRAAAARERRPIPFYYQCPVWGCTDKFMSPEEQTDHLIRIHHYPAHLWFDSPPDSQSSGQQGSASSASASAGSASEASAKESASASASAASASASAASASQGAGVGVGAGGDGGQEPEEAMEETVEEEAEEEPVDETEDEPDEEPMGEEDMGEEEEDPESEAGSDPEPPEDDISSLRSGAWESGFLCPVPAPSLPHTVSAQRRARERGRESGAETTEPEPSRLLSLGAGAKPSQTCSTPAPPPKGPRALYRHTLHKRGSWGSPRPQGRAEHLGGSRSSIPRALWATGSP